MPFSAIVVEAKKVAKSNGFVYVSAVRKALVSSGFRWEVHTTQTMANVRGVKNDIGATDDQTILQAVCGALGREGVQVKANLAYNRHRIAKLHSTHRRCAVLTLSSVGKESQSEFRFA